MWLEQSQQGGNWQETIWEREPEGPKDQGPDCRFHSKCSGKPSVAPPNDVIRFSTAKAPGAAGDRSGGGMPGRRLLPLPVRLGGSRNFDPVPSTGARPRPGQFPAEAPDGPSSKGMASGQTDRREVLSRAAQPFEGSSDWFYIRYSSDL